MPALQRRNGLPQHSQTGEDTEILAATLWGSMAPAQQYRSNQGATISQSGTGVQQMANSAVCAESKPSPQRNCQPCLIGTGCLFAKAMIQYMSCSPAVSLSVSLTRLSILRLRLAFSLSVACCFSDAACFQ